LHRTRPVPGVEDERLFVGKQSYPRQIARLGQVGTLRDQRYVELYLTPLRFDPEAGGLRLAQPYEVTVHFDGAT
ncbi:MAG: hypothetical protein GWN73_01010, partial [Actinobacteria bacterium]|nr:hypothetical protein [Actinomycetota bacterium]NIS28629.1 hypothetical protein [Actinomycetota bacterium]NIU64089.1 hypothetical protein [Actinomycetota bacterium]